MKINGGTQATNTDPILTVPLNEPTVNTAGKASENGLSSAIERSTASTKISISNEFKVIQTALSADSPFDADRVSALKTAIDAGRYNADAGYIANGLIADATELLK